MGKVLFFFTSSYPFGTGETFIENEIEYLANAFDLIVLVSNNLVDTQTRVLPKNVILIRKSYELTTLQKVSAYIHLANPLFWVEKKIIRKKYQKPVSKTIANTMLQSLHKSYLWQNFVKKLDGNYNTLNDHVFLYSYWNNDIAMVCARYRQKHANCTAIARMHGWDVYFEVNRANYLPFRSFIFSNLDKVFAISQKGKEYYQSIFPELYHKIGVSRLGVNFFKLNPLNNSSTLILLSISNLVPIKNISFLIESLSFLNIDFYWYHIGSGPIENELKELANKRIAGKFEFKWQMSNSEVMLFLSDTPIDLIINTSLSEGIPVSIMEAFSFGIPAIAPKIGGIPELVNVDNGWLFSPTIAHEQLAEIISNYWKLSPDEKKRKREKAHDTWRNQFNAENNYLTFIKDFQNIKY